MFKSREDVHKELEMCYDELIQTETNNIGETLYEEHFFFCNTSELLDKNCQKRIKEYNFCKSFNTGPYPSLQETPANIVEEFLTIETEFKKIKPKEK